MKAFSIHSLLTTILILILTTLSLAQDGPDGPRVTISNEQQASKVVNGISSYIDKLTRQPAFTSVASVLATALPSSVVSSLTANANGPLEGVLPTSGAVPTASWFSALPTDVQSYFISAASVENGIAATAVNAASVPRATGQRWREIVAGVVGAAAVLV